MTANHCCAVIRATYKHMRKLERGLPADLPTSGVKWNEENPRSIAITDWSAWADSWRAIPDKEQRAFQILNLLGGFRPGELSRLRWDHVDCKRRLITIRAAKAGHDIATPMSWPIAKALRMARDAIKEAGNDGALVFPSVAVRRGADDLPIWGMGLRHSYATVAGELETDEVIRHCLMGHALEGVSRKYLARFVLQNSAAMRRAQAKISRRVVDLLGIKLFPQK
jgi:integrase